MKHMTIERPAWSYNDGPRIERIVAIEYDKSNTGLWQPHTIFTTDNEHPSSGGGQYDFEWCRRDKQFYWHMSGSGRFYLHNTGCKGSFAIWWDHDIATPENGSNCSGRKISETTVKRFGYKILPDPIYLDLPAEFVGQMRLTQNPFEIGQESQTVWCNKCQDFLPYPDGWDEPCKHVWWCDKCGGWSTPQDRCKHRRDR